MAAGRTIKRPSIALKFRTIYQFYNIGEKSESPLSGPPHREADGFQMLGVQHSVQKLRKKTKGVLKIHVEYSSAVDTRSRFIKSPSPCSVPRQAAAVHATVRWRRLHTRMTMTALLLCGLHLEIS